MAYRRRYRRSTARPYYRRLYGRGDYKSVRGGKKKMGVLRRVVAGAGRLVRRAAGLAKTAAAIGGVVAGGYGLYKKYSPEISDFYENALIPAVRSGADYAFSDVYANRSVPVAAIPVPSAVYQPLPIVDIGGDMEMKRGYKRTRS